MISLSKCDVCLFVQCLFFVSRPFMKSSFVYVVTLRTLNKTIYRINQPYLRNINMMNKLQEFTTQAKKHMLKKTKGGSEPLKANLGPSSHTSEQSNRKKNFSSEHPPARCRECIFKLINNVLIKLNICQHSFVSSIKFSS